MLFFFLEEKEMNNVINIDLILEYIKQNNLSKTQFCKKCKVSPVTFNKILKGDKDVQFKSILKIAIVMRCRLDKLFI